MRGFVDRHLDLDLHTGSRPAPAGIDATTGGSPELSVLAIRLYVRIMVDGRGDVIADLRRKIAAVPARGVDGLGVSEPTASHPSPGLVVPPHLQEVFPGGTVPRGSVVEMTGGKGPVTSVVASVSAAGGFVALVGLARFGLVAAVEQGADLHRVAIINDPGSDPLAVISVLADGLDLIVWEPGPVQISPSAERATAGRLRAKKTSLLVTAPVWGRPDVRMHSTIAGYSGVLPGGGGRISSIEVEVSAAGRGVHPTRISYRLDGSRAAVLYRTAAPAHRRAR
ncbi:hypothetical protein GS887_25900 [Rhodococcus hoagii]|nr:hypothetical protein [Prescottella equi]MBM4719595.1 hypothetical protein [Prescottella equi]NKR23393.1 hypothetical protein [Prescottella equi]NKU37380.1 hypothetical protein [Prescottella equi]NKZ79747.1 hypothetical protein [Prescottella equi]